MFPNFYCIFDQINAAFASRIQRLNSETWIIPKSWRVMRLWSRSDVDSDWSLQLGASEGKSEGITLISSEAFHVPLLCSSAGESGLEERRVLMHEPVPLLSAKRLYKIQLCSEDTECLCSAPATQNSTSEHILQAVLSRWWTKPSSVQVQELQYSVHLNILG